VAVNARRQQPTDVVVRPRLGRPAALALVAVGGAVGTAVRWSLETADPAAPGGWPWTTFWVNVTGALALGVLLEVLAVLGPDDGWRRAARLGVGTGLLGGYTTYSTFVVETVSLGRDDRLLTAFAYDVGSLSLGFLAALAGTVLASRALRRVGRRRLGAVE
jgi:CrcB protein